MKQLLLLSSTLLLLTIAGKAQHIGAGAGLMKDKLAGHLYGGYKFAEIGYIGQQFKKGAHFYLSGGYDIPLTETVTIRPSIIGSLYYVGNTHKQDRYLNQVLSKQETNSSYFGAGLRVSGSMFYTEVGYLSGAYVVFGMRYKW